jgi:hypothetical protein
MRRVAIISSASGSGKTTLGRELARRVDVPLDLPMRVWLPRLLRRTARRIVRQEELWGGNRETLRGAFLGSGALIPYALRNYGRRRRTYPVELAEYPVVRLRSLQEIKDWLAGVESETSADV